MNKKEKNKKGKDFFLFNLFHKKYVKDINLLDVLTYKNQKEKHIIDLKIRKKKVELWIFFAILLCGFFLVFGILFSIEKGWGKRNDQTENISEAFNNDIGNRDNSFDKVNGFSDKKNGYVRNSLNNKQFAGYGPIQSFELSRYNVNNISYIGKNKFFYCQYHIKPASDVSSDNPGIPAQLYIFYVDAITQSTSYPAESPFPPVFAIYDLRIFGDSKTKNPSLYKIGITSEANGSLPFTANLDLNFVANNSLNFLSPVQPTDIVINSLFYNNEQ